MSQKELAQGDHNTSNLAPSFFKVATQLTMEISSLLVLWNPVSNLVLYKPKVLRKHLYKIKCKFTHIGQIFSVCHQTFNVFYSADFADLEHTCKNCLENEFH